MAATADVRRRINRDLQALIAETSFLPELAQVWHGESETNRLVWYSEWFDLMGGLKNLDRAHRSGLMTSDQQVEYLDLLQKLEETVPLLEQMGLPLPSVSLEARTPRD